MSISETGSQTTADRKAAEAELRGFIDRHAPAHLKLINAVRKSLRQLLPTANEVVYEYRAWIVISYSPSVQGYEGVLSIRADADGVKFYFTAGKDLPDPEKILKGSAQVRYIDVESASTLARPAVASLIDEAIARNKVPFARSGSGLVIIRSTSTKKGSTKKASVKNPPSKHSTIRKARAKKPSRPA